VILAFEILLFLLFGLTLAHGLRRFPKKRLLLAFAVIVLLMTVWESSIMLLTNDYTYYGYAFCFGDFPVSIAFAWAVVAYSGYLISLKYNNTILGTFTAASIDLILEPAALFFGLWTWNTNSLHYFNAPVQNCLGWILFTWIGVLVLKKFLRRASKP